MAGKDKELTKEKDSALKEKAIAAIRAHPNYRGKQLGCLPQWLDQLCSQEGFRTHAHSLKKDNALATYAIEQVKYYSQKQGKPWAFNKDTREEKETKKDQGKQKEKSGPWAGMLLFRTEWGHMRPDGLGIECPDVITEDQVGPGSCGLAPMSWEGFSDKARMMLDKQGGPLAVVLQGTLEDCKKKRQWLFQDDFKGAFDPTELYCPATDPVRGRRILEPALLVQFGKTEITLLHQKPEILLSLERRIEMIAVFDAQEHPGCKDLTKETQKSYLENKMLGEPVKVGNPYGCYDVKSKRPGQVGTVIGKQITFRASKEVAEKLYT